MSLEGIKSGLLSCIRILKLRRIIREKGVLNPNREPQINFSKGMTSAILDAMQYFLWHELRRMITPEVLSICDNIETPSFSEIQLVEQDETGTLAAYFAVNFSFDIATVRKMVASSGEILKYLGIALAIHNRYLSALEATDADALYLYFKQNALNENELSAFSSKDLQQAFLRRLIYEESVILNKTVENIIILIEKDQLDVQRNVSFFVDFFREQSYLSSLHFEMFSKAIRIHFEIFEKLLSVRLLIDPFSKQVKYEKWLQDAQKFMFLTQLRTACFSEQNSTILTDFDTKVSLFTKMNKDELILRRFFEENYRGDKRN